MSTHRYVLDVVKTFDGIEQVPHPDRTRGGADPWRCPHGLVMDYFTGPIVYCHDCMEPGLTRLVIEGARDDEVLPAFAFLPIPERRWMEATLSRLRTVATMHAAPTGPTAYAEQKIIEIEREYPVLRRSARGHRVSMAMMATRVGIDRETIPDWVRRGWMRWPPDGENPQL